MKEKNMSLVVTINPHKTKIRRYKNRKGASDVVLWIMSIKITGWSPDYTNRMCHGGHMGVFQPGDLPPHSFCRQIYHPEVKGWSFSLGGGGGQQATCRQVCIYMFSFLPFEKQGDLQVAQVHKAVRRELQPHVWGVMRSQEADRC